MPVRGGRSRLGRIRSHGEPAGRRRLRSRRPRGSAPAGAEPSGYAERDSIRARLAMADSTAATSAAK